MDKELIRWVKFGLFDSENLMACEDKSRLKMIGCSLIKQLALMHERKISRTFAVSEI